MNELAFVVESALHNVCGAAAQSVLAPNISSEGQQHKACAAYRWPRAPRGFLFDDYRLTSLSLSVILRAPVRSL